MERNRGQQDALAAKDPCHHAWGLEFDPWKDYDNRWEITFVSCLLKHGHKSSHK